MFVPESFEVAVWAMRQPPFSQTVLDEVEIDDVIAVHWQGNEEEARALLQAIFHNRQCKELFNIEDCGRDLRERSCPAHSLLLSQRQLDGLVFMRRLAWKLRAEELSVAAPALRAPFEWVKQRIKR